MNGIERLARWVEVDPEIRRWAFREIPGTGVALRLTEEEVRESGRWVRHVASAVARTPDAAADTAVLRARGVAA